MRKTAAVQVPRTLLTAGDWRAVGAVLLTREALQLPAAFWAGWS